MSSFRDVTVFSDAHKKYALAGAHSLDRSECSNAAAFSDAQINQTHLQGTRNASISGVIASRGAQKIDAPPRTHSPCKPTLSGVATFRGIQISRSP